MKYPNILKLIVNWTFWHFNPKRDIRRPSKLKTVEILTKNLFEKKIVSTFCVYTYKYSMTARCSYLSFLVPCLVQPFLKLGRKVTTGLNIFYSFFTRWSPTVGQSHSETLTKRWGSTFCVGPIRQVSVQCWVSHWSHFTIWYCTVISSNLAENLVEFQSRIMILILVGWNCNMQSTKSKYL